MYLRKQTLTTQCNIVKKNTRYGAIIGGLCTICVSRDGKSSIYRWSIFETMTLDSLESHAIISDYGMRFDYTSRNSYRNKCHKVRQMWLYLKIIIKRCHKSHRIKR